MGYIELVTGLGIVVFWVLFFTLGLAPEKPPACYFAFEHAFPLPDFVLAVSLIIGGSLLASDRHSGQALSLACAGGLIFLGRGGLRNHEARLV